MELEGEGVFVPLTPTKKTYDIVLYKLYISPIGDATRKECISSSEGEGILRIIATSRNRARPGFRAAAVLSQVGHSDYFFLS